MSINQDKIKSNIQSDVNSTAPQEPQTHFLKMFIETEAYLLDGFEVHERLAKKMKQFKSHKRGKYGSNNLSSYSYRRFLKYFEIRESQETVINYLKNTE